MLPIVACLSTPAAAPTDSPSEQRSVGAETAVQPAASQAQVDRAQPGAYTPLLAHGFVSIRTLPHAVANPARDASVEYRRAAREVGVVIIDGVAFAQRFYDQEPRVEQRPIERERAQAYILAVAETHPHLRLEDGQMAQPQTFFLRSLTVEGPTCLILGTPTPCTYFGIAARGPNTPVSDGERVYFDAFNQMIELTTQLVDEVFPPAPAATQ